MHNRTRTFVAFAWGGSILVNGLWVRSPEFRSSEYLGRDGEFVLLVGATWLAALASALGYVVADSVVSKIGGCAPRARWLAAGVAGLVASVALPGFGLIGLVMGGMLAYLWLPVAFVLLGAVFGVVAQGLVSVSTTYDVRERSAVGEQRRREGIDVSPKAIR